MHCHRNPPVIHRPPSWRNVKMLAIVSCPIASPIVAMSAHRSEVIIAPPAFRAKIYDGGRQPPTAIGREKGGREREEAQFIGVTNILQMSPTP